MYPGFGEITKSRILPCYPPPATCHPAATIDSHSGAGSSFEIIA